MNTPRKIIPGWRYFECSFCQAHWRESCRDHQTVSSSQCPGHNCPSQVHGGIMPYQSVKDPSLKVNKSGNLVGGEQFEILKKQR
jgi:hypothetical protein